MADSRIKRLLNTFGFLKGRASGMHTDSPVSQQPENTYRNAWGVSSSTTEEKGGGIYSANGMELCAGPPDGHIIRGEYFVEEKDHLVLFCLDKYGRSEIGYIDLNTCTYEKVINDEDIDGCRIGFSEDEWVPIVSKYMRNGTCYELHLYWTNGTYYKKLNLDNPFNGKPGPLKCEDLYLLKCHGGPTPQAYASETGGRDLEGGVYQYVAQLEDDDGNVTNYFQIGAPVSVETPNNLPGELSEQAIHVKLTNLSPEYNKVNIAVIKTVGGHQSAHIVAKLYYTSDGIEFVHRSSAQEMYEIDIEEIRSKKNGYFRGYDIFQFDGRLMPYNLLGEANEDWQDLIDTFDVNYRVVGVPMEYAHLVKGLRADEVYALGIVGNYCDGTRSRTFHLKGRKATAYDRELISVGDDNCLECTAERWKVENTAERTAIICDDPDTIGPDLEDIEYDTGDPIYVGIPKNDGPPLDEDEADAPTEDDIRKIGEDQLRDIECICKRLASLFAIFEKAAKRGYVYTPNFFTRFVGDVLSDPVAIAQAYCACERFANDGGANDDGEGEGINEGGNEIETDGSTNCECCSLCGGEQIDYNCDCCDDCID